MCNETDFFVQASKTKYKVPGSGEKIRAYDSFIDGGEMLFYLMDNNLDNELLVQVTKYVLYKMTGINFGVEELDTDIFSLRAVSSSIDIEGRYGTVMQMIILMEGGDELIDGRYYRIYDLEGMGLKTAGHGVVLQYHEAGLARFGKSSSDYYVGGLIEAEIVDQLFLDEIQDMADRVNTVTAGLGLKEWQVDALISRAFNCGPYGSTGLEAFVRAYNTYGDTDALYNNFMCIPVTDANGRYYPGLTKRRQWEWQLFHEGIYQVEDWIVYASDVDYSGSGGSSDDSDSDSTPTSTSTTTGPRGYVHPCPGASYISSYPGSHTGYDFSGAIGTPIYAVTSGTVSFQQSYDVSSRKLVSYGNWISQSTSDGKTVIYAHLNGFKGVNLSIPSSNSAGYPSSANSNTRTLYLDQRTVQKGELIGYMGTTGNSTGSHLHFEIRGIGNTATDYRQYIPSPN